METSFIARVLESLTKQGGSSGIVIVAIVDAVVLVLYLALRSSGKKSDDRIKEMREKAIAEKATGTELVGLESERVRESAPWKILLRHLEKATAEEFGGLLRAFGRMIVLTIFMLLTSVLISLVLFKGLAESRAVDESRSLKWALNLAIGARTAEEARDVKAAIEKMGAVRDKVASPDVAQYLADLQCDFGSFSDAIGNYRYAEELFGRPTTKTRIGIAVAEIGLGDYDKARRDLDQAWRLGGSENADSNAKFIICVDRGKSYVEEVNRLHIGDNRKDEFLKRAAKEYTTALKHQHTADKRQLAVLHGNLGKVLLGLGDANGAEAQYRAQIDVEQKLLRISYLYAQFNLAASLVGQKGKEAEARRLLTSIAGPFVVRQDPTAGAVQVLLGNISASQGKKEEARQEFKSALALGRAQETQNDLVVERASKRLKQLDHL